jgi:hypothetical protein
VCVFVCVCVCVCVCVFVCVCVCVCVLGMYIGMEREQLGCVVAGLMYRGGERKKKNKTHKLPLDDVARVGRAIAIRPHDIGLAKRVLELLQTDISVSRYPSLSHRGLRVWKKTRTSSLNTAMLANTDPVAFWHDEQWHRLVKAGSPFTVSWTAPHRHEPLRSLGAAVEAMVSVAVRESLKTCEYKPSLQNACR